MQEVTDSNNDIEFNLDNNLIPLCYFTSRTSSKCILVLYDIIKNDIVSKEILKENYYG